MKRRLYFLHRYRALVVFLGLEAISTTLICHRNVVEKTSLVKAINCVMGTVNEYIHEIRSYPLLKQAHIKLLHENAALRNQLVQNKVQIAPLRTPAASTQYRFIPAKVVNNSIVRTKNYLTINQGAMHGIAPGMGVIAHEGIVGRVNAVSERFATVISLLHTDLQVAAKISSVGVIGTVNWQGTDPFQAQLLYITRHVPLKLGDTVVTSGYNATFPEDILIGTIKHIQLQKGSPFYDITLTISTQFSMLQHVYVVDHCFKQEKKALEQYTKTFYE